MTNALVFDRDIDLQGHNILNAGNLSGAASQLPASEVIRWDDEEEFQTADIQTPIVLRHAKVNFARFSNVPAMTVTLEADLKRESGESTQCQVNIAIDPDDSQPPASFFGSAVTGSGTFAPVDYSMTAPVPKGRASVRLIGWGTGRVKNVVLTIAPVAPPPPVS